MSRLTKQQRQRRELKALLRRFSLRRPKNGELVITAEIARVTDANWGRRHHGARDVDDNHIEVTNAWPRRGVKHIVRYGCGGQRAVFILRERKRK